MLIKKITKGLIVAVVTWGLTLNSSIVMAVEEQEKESEAEIMFEADSSTELPTDPLNPGQPIKPVNPGWIGGNEGPLSIDYASSFYFGKNTFSTINSVSYKAIAQASDLGYRPLFVQVTDKTGSHAGWTLSVRQNGQFKNNDKELVGATLSLSGGQLVTISQAPKPSVVTEALILNPHGVGESQLLVKADTNQGAGQYVYRFGDGTDLKEVKDEENDVLYHTTDHVTLRVPGGANVLKGAYTTTLTWTLANVPSSL